MTPINAAAIIQEILGAPICAAPATWRLYLRSTPVYLKLRWQVLSVLGLSALILGAIFARWWL